MRLPFAKPRKRPKKRSGFSSIVDRRTVKQKLEAKRKLQQGNPSNRAKRQKRAGKHHRAYMKSEPRRAVEQRSGGRCEAAVRVYPYCVEFQLHFQCKAGTDRCTNDATEHHHRTYARYGGNELPRDLAHLCKACHRIAEALKPHKGGLAWQSTRASQ